MTVATPEVRALRADLHDEATTTVGRCLPYGEGVAYWPVAEIARRLAGDATESALAPTAGGGAPTEESELIAARVARALDPPSRAVPTVRRLVLSHGDFTPSQVLGLDGHAPAVLDLDTLRWADPAEDLGRYLAHVALLAAKGGDPSPGDTLELLAEELVGGYVEAAARPTAP